MVLEEKNGEEKLEEWSESAEPRLNRALIEYLLERSKVPTLEMTIEF